MVPCMRMQGPSPAPRSHLHNLLNVEGQAIGVHRDSRHLAEAHGDVVEGQNGSVVANSPGDGEAIPWRFWPLPMGASGIARPRLLKEDQKVPSIHGVARRGPASPGLR